MPKTVVLKRPPREEVTGRILEAATSAFAVRGYAATTMQDVATAVGMTAPALYYYFDSKQRLLFEAIELELERFVGLVDSEGLATARGAAADLALFVRTHVQFQLENPASSRLYNAMFLGTNDLLAALTARQRTELRRFQGRVRERLRQILDRGVEAGELDVVDPTVTAMSILAVGEYAGSWFRPGGRLEPAEIADRCAELALRMVGAA